MLVSIHLLLELRNGAKGEGFSLIVVTKVVIQTYKDVLASVRARLAESRRSDIPRTCLDERGRSKAQDISISSLTAVAPSQKYHKVRYIHRVQDLAIPFGIMLSSQCTTNSGTFKMTGV